MARECNDKVFVATTSSSVLVDAFCSRWTLFLACDICFCLNIFETNYMLLREARKRPHERYSYLASVLCDCLDLVSYLNAIAHKLVKFSFSLSDFVWIEKVSSVLDTWLFAPT